MDNKALPSADGRRPLRSLTRKNRTKCEWMKRAERSTILGFKLTTCKCQELHARGYQPGRRACTCYEIPGIYSSWANKKADKAS